MHTCLPTTRLMSTEALESRWLLSGVAPSSADDDADEKAEDAVDVEDGEVHVTASEPVEAEKAADGNEDEESLPAIPASPPTFNVEVVELELGDEDESDGDVDVSRSKLTRAVLDAFNTNFPDAKWIASEYGIDDGAGEYDITAEFQGHVIDVTLTPAGEIIETEQAITSDELPKEVLDWVRERFGTAEIDEASVMFEGGELGYEVLVESPGGEEFEATLRVPGAELPEGFPIVDGAEAPPAESPTLAVPPSVVNGAGSDIKPVNADQAAVEPAVLTDSAPVDAGAQTAAVDAEAAPPTNADEPVADTAVTAAETVVRLVRIADAAASMQALASGAPAAEWLPALAGLLEDVLPVDVLAVERGLNEVLREVESLAADLGGEASTVRNGVSPLALAFGLIAVTQLYLLNSRRNRGGPMVVFNAATSSWSWVLGAMNRTTQKKP
jgi:hypothetical protein